PAAVDSPPCWRGGEGLRGGSLLQRIAWQALLPDSRHTWLVLDTSAEFDTFLPMGVREIGVGKGTDPEAIFKIYSLGVTTNRDDVVYDFDQNALVARVKSFIDDYNSE